MEVDVPIKYRWFSVTMADRNVTDSIRRAEIGRHYTILHSIPQIVKLLY